MSHNHHPLSRREFIKLVAVGAGGALLASCERGGRLTVVPTPTSSPSAVPTLPAATTANLILVSGVGELVDTDAGNNDLLYTGPGGQESPAVAWADDGTQGLLAWEDDRNGASYDIYGLRLEAVPVTAGNRIFLPLVVRND